MIQKLVEDITGATKKRKDFLIDVAQEITSLKKNATPEELAKLDFNKFNPIKRNQCIYGLLTGDCTTPRAKELMDTSCTRVMNIPNGSIEIIGKRIQSRAFKINGPYTGQPWREPYLLGRFHYMSALEGYICSKDANNKDILSYLKGETETFPVL